MDDTPLKRTTLDVDVRIEILLEHLGKDMTTLYNNEQVGGGEGPGGATQGQWPSLGNLHSPGPRQTGPSFTDGRKMQFGSGCRAKASAGRGGPKAKGGHLSTCSTIAMCKVPI